MEGRYVSNEATQSFSFALTLFMYKLYLTVFPCILVHEVPPELKGKRMDLATL